MSEEKILVSVRIGNEMRDELLAIAKREDCSLGFLIRRALRKLLRDDKTHPEETVDIKPLTRTGA